MSTLVPDIFKKQFVGAEEYTLMSSIDRITEIITICLICWENKLFCKIGIFYMYTKRLEASVMHDILVQLDNLGWIVDEKDPKCNVFQ